MNEHRKILESILKDNYKNILDLGSGKTSMSFLLERFKESKITGICYPGDNRKTDKIKEECVGKYELMELDICKKSLDKEFDLILCHLLFGEAVKFGNTVKDMASKVFNLNGEKILVVDYLEDPEIDFELLISVAISKGYYIIKKEIFKKEQAEEYSSFIGENYIAILFKRIDKKQ